MSGDVGLDNEPIIFYTEEMTVSKLIVLRHKGIKFNHYNTVMNKIKETHERRTS